MRTHRLGAAVLAACALACCPALAANHYPLTVVAGREQTLPTGTGLQVNPSTITTPAINIPCASGVAPASPQDGDVWCEAGLGLFIQVGGVTIGPFSGSTAALTATGSPTSGSLATWSGPSSLTNGNLSGDVSTSGSLATTLAASGVTAGSYTSANITVDSKGRVTAASNGSSSGAGDTFYDDPGVLPISKPTAASFTVNAGTGITATATNMASRGVSFQASSGSGNSATLEVSAVSLTSFTVTALVQVDYPFTVGVGTFFGIAIKDSAGKYVGFGYKYTSGTTLAYFTFANLSSTGTSAANISIGMWPTAPVWLRVQLSGGNFNFYISQDGENFVKVLTEGATAFLGSTLSTVGLIVENNGTGVALNINDYSFTNTTP